MLAIIASLKHWRLHLQGAKHTVRVLSDHKNLQYFMTKKLLNQRQNRWAIELSQYNISLEYRKGRLCIIPDKLSRIHEEWKTNKKDIPPRQLIPKEVLGNTTNKMEISQADFHQIFMNSTIARLNNHNRNQALKKGYKTIQWKKELRYWKQQALHLKTTFFVKHGIYYLKDNKRGPLIMVPPGQDKRIEIIKDHHDSPTAGHPGYIRTLELIRRQYIWPTIKKDVYQYTKHCDLCQRTKYSRKNRNPPLQAHDIPDRPWKVILADFITGLPSTTQGNNAIFVVVDKFSKQAHFIPTRDTIDAQGTANL